MRRYFGYAQIFKDVRIYFEQEQVFQMCAYILSMSRYFGYGQIFYV
jgi:hypothetical protein